MAKTLEAHDKLIREIFEGSYQFEIPDYQRPYAWTTEQATELFDDLYSAMQDARVSGASSQYFLGSIVLIKNDRDPKSSVVDGQQRLSTLTMLFAVLRTVMPDAADDITDFLYKKGKVSLGEKNEYRLTAREEDADFFRTNIQEPGGIAQLVASTDKLKDSRLRYREKAKAFVRSYGFLAAILSYGHPTWEKLSIFLNFLIPKLPAPKEEDRSKGVLETIDMDSYRVEAKAALKMAMDDADATVDPVPPGGGGGKGEADIDRLSAIIKTFNDLFGNIEWKDEDKIRKVIAEEIPARVAQDKAYQNAQANSDKQNAKLEHDKALNRVVLELLSDHTELFKQFSDNPNFKRWLTDTVFDATYQQGTVPPKMPPQAGARL